MHAFLGLLQCRFTKSVDYMLAFIYLAYPMMALLHETVPAFEDAWTKYLRDWTWLLETSSFAVEIAIANILL
jgi:hypothetical protein